MNESILDIIAKSADEARQVKDSRVLESLKSQVTVGPRFSHNGPAIVHVQGSDGLCLIEGGLH